MSEDLFVPRGMFAKLALLAVIVIIYGSLIPFEYRALPLDQAIENFVNIKWRNIGIGGRADLVANIVLYLPFGFFGCAALGRRTLVGALLTALIGVCMAVSLEFLQTWAAPRTQSLNDILAEIVGTGLGIIGWALLGKVAVRTTQTALTDGQKAVSAALALYLLAYTFVALFPFDFLVNQEEIVARLGEPEAIVWIPEHTISLRGLIQLVLKTALMFPLGFAAKLVWRRSLRTTLMAAGAFSLTIEIINWFEYSAQSDAISIIVAIIGAALGYIMATSSLKTVLRLAPFIPQGAWLVAPIYLAILPVMRGWSIGYVGLQRIEEVLGSLHWMPFYYHYMTSERNAFASLVSVAISYAPIGALVWAMKFRAGEAISQVQPLSYTASVAGFLALIVEAGVLLTAGLRPDPTNILIAIMAAMLMQRFSEWAARVLPGVLRTNSNPQ